MNWLREQIYYQVSLNLPSLFLCREAEREGAVLERSTQRELFNIFKTNDEWKTVGYGYLTDDNKLTWSSWAKLLKTDMGNSLKSIHTR